MKTNVSIYIACPAHTATGGTEAMHVLCYELLRLGLTAVIFYIDIKDKGAVVPARFTRFNVPYVVELEDSASSWIIIPETHTELIKRFPLMKKSIWWLSVDNYVRPLRFCGPRDMFALLRDRILKRNVNFNDDSICHLCQSYYAMNFVRQRGAKNVHFLMDYLGEEHLAPVDLSLAREDIILYNPSKGLPFTRRIMKTASKRFRFVALRNMSPEVVHAWCLRAKVYIDFGNHPGKDRFPREAAMAGCIVITSKRGAAAFYEDLPIPDRYKFEDSRREIAHIIALLSDCMSQYAERQSDFADYRAFIRADRVRFEEQVKAIFVDKDGA